MSRGFVLPSQISPPIVAAASAVSAQASNYVATDQSTGSASYAALATAQAVTITTGTAALVILTATMRLSVTGNIVHMGFAVSGATTTAASDNYSASMTSAVAGVGACITAVYPVVLNAGSNTFTALFKTTTPTGNFERRAITVLAVS